MAVLVALLDGAPVIPELLNVMAWVAAVRVAKGL